LDILRCVILITPLLKGKSAGQTPTTIKVM
jgi:hypothetical protein